MLPVLKGHIPPRLIARLTRCRYRPPAPQFFTSSRIVRRNDTGLRFPARPPGNHFAIRNNRPGTLHGAVGLVIENFRFPHQVARARIKRKHIPINARIDDQVVINRNISIVRPLTRIAHIVWNLTAVLPQQITRHRIDRLNHIPRIGHVEHAIVGQWRSLLATGRECARPHQLQVTDILRGDLVQGTITPAIKCSAPHKPVFRSGVLQHGIGHWLKLR